MPRTFKELFAIIAHEFQTAPGDFNANYYTKLAEQIALDKKGNSILFSVFITAVLAGTIFFEEIRLSKRDRIIAKQRLALEIPAEDSLQFKCTHCGWEHSLQAK